MVDGKAERKFKVKRLDGTPVELSLVDHGKEGNVFRTVFMVDGKEIESKVDADLCQLADDAASFRFRNDQAVLKLHGIDIAFVEESLG